MKLENLNLAQFLNNFKTNFMKRKLLALLFLATLILNLDAQSFTNKKGEVVTPEAGDWALGFNAVPVFDYFGNLLNGNTANTFFADWATTNNSIYGKYFTADNFAYRGSLRLMSFSQTNKFLTDTSSGVKPSYITDLIKFSGAAVVLGAGFEKHRGKGRIHGIYGAEALLTFGGTTPNTSYSYAIEMNKTNIDNGLLPFSRIIQSNAGATLGFGVRGFIGVEYYILPKISVAAEYGWGLTYTQKFNGKNIYEKWGFADADAIEPSRYEVTNETGGNNYFGIDTDNNAGAIKLIFHF